MTMYAVAGGINQHGLALTLSAVGASLVWLGDGKNRSSRIMAPVAI